MSDRIIINRIEIENLGRIKKLFCDSLSGINLIIGENGSGKTFLLKALYSAIRTTEEYKRGDDIRNANGILAEVVALHIFDSFADLYSNLPLLECGYTEDTIQYAKPDDMLQYYSQDKWVYLYDGHINALW